MFILAQQLPEVQQPRPDVVDDLVRGRRRMSGVLAAAPAVVVAAELRGEALAGVETPTAAAAVVPERLLESLRVGVGRVGVGLDGVVALELRRRVAA